MIPKYQLQYAKGISTLKLDNNKCIHCLRCIEVCPHAVFHSPNKKLEIKDHDSCMECGACAKNCPTEALQVQVGVGCAELMIKRLFLGDNATCGCDNNSSNCC